MIDLAQIISEVQLDVNDEAGERVQRAEYVDMTNTVIRKIAEKTQIWIGRYVATPNPSATPVSPAPFKANIPLTDSLGNNISPWKFLRVVRSDGTTWAETREYSLQAIGRKSSGKSMFPINQIDAGGNVFSTQLHNDSNGGTNSVDGSITMNFATAFEQDEQVVFDFIQNVPFLLTTLTVPIGLSIPSWMEDAVKYGLLYKVQERLYNKGDETMTNRLLRTEQLYNRHVRDAQTYAYNLKDEHSTYQSFPRQILPE
jgi:hypothetical protein